jgi:hypothetical protein
MPTRAHNLTLLLTIILLSAVTLHADVFAPSDLVYRGEPVTLCYTVIPPVCVTNGIVWKFRNWNPQIVPLGQIDTFDATFDGQISGAPFTLDGTITLDIPGRNDLNQLGTFPFTITQFDFFGFADLDGAGPAPPQPVMIRESPTLLSTGQTTITQPGGDFRVTSFFDVFTEISLDGGANWHPNIGPPTHMEANPEPASLILTGGVLILIARRIRRGSGRP